MKFLLYTVMAVISAAVLVTADESRRRSALRVSEQGNRTASQVQCVEDEQYPNENLCCKNCEAGTHVGKPCDRNSEKGACVPCEPDTYTEHSNGMLRCLQCTPCRKDQTVVAVCRPTKNTKCECRPGTYCEPEQACEVCKKCTKCKDNEVKVKNCTSASNTVCRKGAPTQTMHTPTSAPAPGNGVHTAVYWLLGIVLIPILGVIVWYSYKKKKPCKKSEVKIDQDSVRIPVCEESDRSMEEQQNNQNARIEEPQQEGQRVPEEMPLMLTASPQEDEDRGLGDSLPNTTSSSQTSSPRHSPETPRQHAVTEVHSNQKLIPLNGEESLKKTFDIFAEELASNNQKRFFRDLGLNDNTIKNTMNAHPDDGVYELLKIWMQREGLKADINDLLKVLLNLNLRLTAETIIKKAIEKNWYKYEDERC